MAYITKLTPAMDGAFVTGRILGRHFGKGLLHYEDGKWYILNDTESGTECKDLKGFKYSWCVRNGTEEHLEQDRVKELELVNPLFKNATAGELVEKFKKVGIIPKVTLLRKTNFIKINQNE